ncbi:MAG: endonuclease/exonuclease/phosphatase family protein, partial [Rhodospirillales bacterium]|nr:endonuclease/exonuclease/phosphatase family protein [Rhodospirillales bacterium]
MRIATFNLENLDPHPRAGIDFADRLDVLRPQFLRLRADILCLQEVNASDTSRKGPRILAGLDHLLEGTGYEGYHRVVSLNRDGKRYSDRHNLVILSRYPVESHRQIWHDLVPPPQAPEAIEWERPVLHAVLRHPSGKLLHLLNLHLRAPRAAHVEGGKMSRGIWQSVGGWAEGFFRASVKQAGQALEVRLVLEEIFDERHDAWVAVCGDFNADDRETTIRTIRGDEEDTGNGHLAHRVLVPVERSLPESQRFSAIHHGRRIMLDHVLVSRPLLAWYRASEVHN